MKTYINRKFIKGNPSMNPPKKKKKSHFDPTNMEYLRFDP